MPARNPFRDYREDRAEHRKVRTLFFGAAQFLYAVRGHSDHKLRGRDRAQERRRYGISAEVDSVRASRERDIEAGIHQTRVPCGLGSARIRRTRTHRSRAPRSFSRT